MVVPLGGAPVGTKTIEDLLIQKHVCHEQNFTHWSYDIDRKGQQL